VVRWARERFRRFWARLSGTNRRGRGRPGTGVEIRRLIGRMASANPLWRTPRLHGELQMLAIQISERTVARILGRLRGPPSQTWKTLQPPKPDGGDRFLHRANHHAAGAVRVRVLEHRRRQVLHFSVTEHPTAGWTARQIVEAFADRVVPG
jgi:hypothetical protein